MPSPGLSPSALKENRVDDSNDAIGSGGRWVLLKTFLVPITPAARNAAFGKDLPSGCLDCKSLLIPWVCDPGSEFFFGAIDLEFLGDGLDMIDPLGIHYCTWHSVAIKT
jgi:hypothetical protein